jgi:hypothetical protein
MKFFGFVDVFDLPRVSLFMTKHNINMDRLSKPISKFKDRINVLQFPIFSKKNSVSVQQKDEFRQSYRIIFLTGSCVIFLCRFCMCTLNEGEETGLYSK